MVQLEQVVEDTQQVVQEIGLSVRDYNYSEADRPDVSYQDGVVNICFAKNSRSFMRGMIEFKLCLNKTIEEEGAEDLAAIIDRHPLTSYSIIMHESYLNYLAAEKQVRTFTPVAFRKYHTSELSWSFRHVLSMIQGVPEPTIRHTIDALRTVDHFSRTRLASLPESAMFYLSGVLNECYKDISELEEWDHKRVALLGLTRDLTNHIAIPESMRSNMLFIVYSRPQLESLDFLGFLSLPPQVYDTVWANKKRLRDFTDDPPCDFCYYETLTSVTEP